MQAITKNHPKLRVARRILKQVASKISHCQTCDQIVKVIKSKIVDINGLPQRLRSDNARNLIEEPVAQYCKEQFILQESAIRYRHTTNQIIERAFRTLFEMLRKMPKVKRPFFENLKIASFRINNIKSDKGISPAELFFNFMPRTLQDNKYNIQSQYNVKDMRTLYELLHSLEKLPKEIIIKNFDLKKTKAENCNVTTSGGKYVNKFEVLFRSKKWATGNIYKDKDKKYERNSHTWNKLFDHKDRIQSNQDIVSVLVPYWAFLKVNKNSKKGEKYKFDKAKSGNQQQFSGKCHSCGIVGHRSKNRQVKKTEAVPENQNKVNMNAKRVQNHDNLEERIRKLTEENEKQKLMIQRMIDERQEDFACMRVQMNKEKSSIDLKELKKDVNR
uniref:Integrase catalytic domain-containing protein n=1 Tax=Strongyloides venezuelensis TaxID=75913 RepID=A0A0K0FBE2_STRVS